MPELQADCGRCVGLCCVAPAFMASADFAIDKPAGQPCPNLRADSRCAIHDQLRPRGFPGCAVYDCFGAGQHVTQHTFAGRDWRRDPATASRMFEVFAVMRHLHELLWHLTEALALEAARPVHAELRAALDRTSRLTDADADTLLAVDVRAHRAAVNALLVRASELTRVEVTAGVRDSRTGYRGARRRLTQRQRAHSLPGAELRGADLIGADLRHADLRGANLRGARLIGADLREADLELADLTGADFRSTDLAGTNLHRSLFVTQAQLDSATGDAATRLPAGRARPAHWPAGPQTP